MPEDNSGSTGSATLVAEASSASTGSSAAHTVDPLLAALPLAAAAGGLHPLPEGHSSSSGEPQEPPHSDISTCPADDSAPAPAVASAPEQGHIQVHDSTAPCTSVPADGAEPVREGTTANKSNTAACDEASTCVVAPDDASSTAECRICYMCDAPERLVTPCSCQGSLQYTHLGCLQLWTEERGSKQCEICGQEYRAELLPHLKDAVERAQQREHDRTTYMPSHELAHYVAELHTHIAGHRQTSPRDILKGNWFCIAALVCILMLVLLYIVLFVSTGNQPSSGGVTVLRVLSFLLPLLLIVQVALSYRRHCRLRIANAASRV